MMTATTQCKVGFTILLVALAVGCTPRAPRPSETKIPAAPAKAWQWHEHLDQAAADHPDTVATKERVTGGIVVHMDPSTGEPTPMAAESLPIQQLETQKLHSASAPPQIQELLSSAPGGGVMVHLNRQFHRPLIATIDADGSVHLHHGPIRESHNETE